MNIEFMETKNVLEFSYKNEKLFEFLKQRIIKKFKIGSGLIFDKFECEYIDKRKGHEYMQIVFKHNNKCHYFRVYQNPLRKNIIRIIENYV